MIQYAGNMELDILIVEDNPGDVRLMAEILKEGASRFRLSTCPDGVEALRYLRRQEPYGNASTPALILLDLNLPRMDGMEFLSIVKADERLRRIPVIVLTTSGSEQDVVRAYDLHASCYLVKPASLEEFVEVIRLMENFWFRTVRLPGRN